MTSPPLYDTDLPIRSEILEAQFAAVQHWAAPGTWWSATERLAIVDEVRQARDADALPPWTAPSTVEGLIPDAHLLPTSVIDVIWRLTNHLTMLTRDWYETVVPNELSAGQYVEVVALVAQANLVDRFADALALPRPELLDPQPGEPSAEVPDGAEIHHHWVPTAPIQDGSWKPPVAADIPNVRKALSLVPAERRMQWVLIDGHYVPGGALSVEFTHRLDRSQIELIGARTSAANECFY